VTEEEQEAADDKSFEKAKDAGGCLFDGCLFWTVTSVVVLTAVPVMRLF
jgi:hypothetical protein